MPNRLLAPDVPFLPLLIALSGGILLLEVFVPYRYYCRFLKFLTLSLLAYVATGIMKLGPSWTFLDGWSAVYLSLNLPGISRWPGECVAATARKRDSAVRPRAGRW